MVPTKRHKRETIEKLRAMKASGNYVNLKEKAEQFGLAELKDIPFRIKRTCTKRNACKTKKRKARDTRSHGSGPISKNLYADLAGFDKLLREEFK